MFDKCRTSKLKLYTRKPNRLCGEANTTPPQSGVHKTSVMHMETTKADASRIWLSAVFSCFAFHFQETGFCCLWRVMTVCKKKKKKKKLLFGDWPQAFSVWWRLSWRNDRGTTCTSWQQRNRTWSPTPPRPTVPSASPPCSQERASCSESVCTPSAGPVQYMIL